MIRPLSLDDLNQVLDIWLSANLQAHSFIPASYWQSQLEAVRQSLPQAEVYVWEEEGEILGFLGLEGGYIAGIFVRYGAQSRGVGKKLLDQAKAVRDRLSLCVYEKNTRAAGFYRREGFSLQGEQTDRTTGEREYRMGWQSREEKLC
ncbi:MAG: GNAT family N-acetyltransferase [Lawsonibacter sp.]|nr:GNAT family N-acetyltransferase [Lawsonibacter sp.]